LDRLTQAALVTVTLTLSIAGLDILGSKLFFGLQHASAPLIATLFLTYATLKVLSRETIRSSRLDALERIFATAHPWNIVPNRTSSTDLTLVIPVLESRDSIVSVERIDRLAREHLAELQKLNPQAQAELLLISFGELQSEFHPVRVWAKKLEAEFSQVSHLESRARKTPGLLYQRAFLRARGRWVAFINAEQPADPSWVTQAWKQAQSTPELGLIRANRRLSESVLEFAPQSRGLTESRTRQSLAINRGIRRLFGIQSTDLHSGTFLVRRDLAEIAFALQASVGQLFDLELSLIARNHAFQEMSLPSRFQVIGEYRGRRVIAEIARFFIQIPRVAWRLSQGYYSPQNIQAVFAADDWGMSPGINRGMLELARAGVLKQVSMMANSRHLESQIEELKSFKSTHPDFKCGLHFNLTYGKSLADPAHALQSFGRTTLTFALERLTGGDQLKNWVRSELTAQIDRLESLGFKPDFIDGHHHAHLIPGVLEATSDILNARGIRRVRLPYDRGLWLSPRMALNLLAMRARPLFKKNHWEYLNFFYPSAQLLQDQGKFRARLSRLGISEVIVHPAAFADWSQFEQKDPYLDGRIDEFKALRQLAFSQTDPSRPPQAT
jgi:predicted glycoside hydrolase/deacetylase ChbG (UPF0249 family)